MVFFMEEKDFKSLVIEKAKEIFTAYGYKKTNMEDIAKACHKSKALIYHHYKSKEEIFRICVNNEINQLLYDLKKIADTDISVKEKFNSFFSTSISWFNDKTNNIYHKIVIEIFDYVDIIKEDIEKFHDKIIELLKKIIREGMEKNVFSQLYNIEEMTVLIIQMMIGSIYAPLGQILNLNIKSKTDIKKFLNLIYYGLEKR